MKRINEADVPGWLRPGGDRLLTGYANWWWMDGKATAWILHTLFRNHALPDLTWDQMAKQNDPALRALAESGTQRKSTTLGPEWQRVRWHDQAKVLGRELTIPPSQFNLWGPFDWMISWSRPSEGFIDRTQFERLVPLLAAASAGGSDAECTVIFPELAFPLELSKPGYGGQVETTVGGLANAYSALEIGPCNIWANDAAWFVYTDYDGCETKVIGPPPLIDAILADEVLEAVPG